MSDVILCNLSDAHETILEAREIWIREVLLSIGVPDEIINLADIREFRYEMEQLGIEVELYENGDVDIFKKKWHKGPTEEASGWLPTHTDYLVGQWKEPKYIRKVEGKGAYYELHLNEWSILSMRQQT